MVEFRRQFIHLSLSLVTASLLFISCNTSKNVNIERGTGYNFEAGKPEFRTSAFGYIDEKSGPTLQIRAEIVKGSLIYKSKFDSLWANIAVDIQIQDISNPGNVISSKHVEKHIESTDPSIKSTRETLDLEYNMQVKPSRYKVVINVQDLNSDKNVTQSIETYIPETSTGAYSLSKVQMYGKINGQDWDPIDTYDVKGRIDSLRFVFQVISEKTDEQMRLNARLLRFKSDTSYARPMHYSNYSPSSIEYKGIDYDEDTELQSNQRILTDYSSVFIEYKFANQKRGNYRFEVTAQKQDEDEVYKARAFGVKSKNYPAISSTREMARPMIYLMGEGDYKDMMSIQDTDSLKKEMDRFWLKHIGNAGRARDVIQMYYERVEEANKQFSNYKEGWKTDLGMVYILFGPPWYTENHLKELDWYYSYNREDPDYSYIFYQPKLKNKYYPFYHFLLQRNNYYYTVEYQQRQLWLTGQILRRQL